MQSAVQVYEKLTEAGIEVLYDDRSDVGAGQKFADADLLGIPVRLVVSAKTIEAGMIEWKNRSKADSELITFEEVLDRLS
jgi:prolyl-tRNA synthetase